MEFDVDLIEFQQLIWDFYGAHGRKFAWRNVANPYYIVVSEIMLQQTQTSRVEGKYECFIQTFPDFKSLAEASLRDVLLIWQGLGYNRRAKALHDCARKVVAEFGGVLPQTQEILLTFPGLGPTTSASICAFAFNQPTIFVETNIRAVFIHHFFKNCGTKVHDKEILLLVQQTIDKKDPRNWYYALMDYGVMLKKQYVNPSRRSAHYVKQARFEGSDRQIRGLIIKLLTRNGPMALASLCIVLNFDNKRIEKALRELCHDGLLKSTASGFDVT